MKVIYIDKNIYFDSKNKEQRHLKQVVSINKLLHNTEKKKILKLTNPSEIRVMKI